MTKKSLVYLISGYILTYQVIVLKVVGILPASLYFELRHDFWGMLALFGAIFEMWGLYYISASVIAISKLNKKAEEEIHFLAQGMEQSTEGIVILDASSHIRYVNASFEKISGHKRDEMIGEYLEYLPSHNEPSEKGNLFWDSVLGGYTWKDRIPNCRRGDQIYTMEVIVSPIYDLEGKVTSLLARCHDITQDLELEQRLLQMQKLESIGTFVSGIAHDFNNILNAIVGNTELAKEDIPTGSYPAKKLENVLFSASRAKEVIHQLIAFCRKEDTKPIETDLQTNIRDALKLLNSIIPKSITINTTLCSSTDKILAVPGQIYQIIMNLGVNAAHSIQSAKGKIEVILETEDLDSNSILNYPELSAKHLYKLTFTDSGCGIEPNVIKRIFDPYFTTKTLNEGSGLGLSVVHNIVTTLEGTIRVESEVGKGTKFVILIPRKNTESLVDTDPAMYKTILGTEKILFVDDEMDIVNIASQYLGKQGYQINGFTSSMEALEHFEKISSDYDMLITDATMPRLTGMELAKRINNLRPDLPIILITGYANQITPQKAHEMGISNYLMKPYNNRSLAELIRSTIDGQE